MGSNESARPRAVGFALVTAILFGLGACDDPTVSQNTQNTEVTSVLQSERVLTSGCYDFPPEDPAHIDRVETRVAFAPGDAAVDFTLDDVDGVPHRLADLLETRPVVLIFGSYS